MVIAQGYPAKDIGTSGTEDNGVTTGPVNIDWTMTYS